MLSIFHALVLSLTISWVPSDRNHTGFKVYYGTELVAVAVMDTGKAVNVTTNFSFDTSEPLCFYVVAYSPVGNSTPSDKICIRGSGTEQEIQTSAIMGVSCSDFR